MQEHEFWSLVWIVILKKQCNFVLTIDTDSAITQIVVRLHNTFGVVTHKKVRQITMYNTANNILHKRQSEVKTNL